MPPIIWDDAAQRLLSKEIIKKTRRRSLKEAREIEQQILQESRLVGSSIYTKMFQASKQEPKEKLALLLGQLGAQMEEGTLQLLGPYQIDANMPPHGEFLRLLAKTVQQAYSGKVLDDPQVHQLRMYLDRHNITYIRQLFGGQGITDEAALSAYVRASKKSGGLGGQKLIAERARFHNKYQHNYQPGGENRKRLTPDFHGEFILDENGHFVSQWNVLEFDSAGKLITDFDYYRKRCGTYTQWHSFQQQILNGESFNYADRNDLVHRRLDILPPGQLDHPLRKEIAKEWKNPANKVEYHWKKADKQKDGYSQRDLIKKRAGWLSIFLLIIGIAKRNLFRHR
ncbi:DUF3114 domain-containing protein [Enterococcus sp. 669A]|uniref:DUF3114 domain-containing protein n=1 Tax=Candidatus Enterococcus moelleringii TaxID=2815325 RepID=A0ABS3LG65_9ENTE|nr:DUF3114 domain-containing protein [Enterococcus sp. 669A]MBO1308634.1 DUF3114 domain-containing protein [Enterococcus sp. 669A]